MLQRLRGLFGLELPLPLGRSAGALDSSGAFGVSGAVTGQALSFADPLLRNLSSLPAALWHGPSSEALALGLYYVEIDG